LSQSNFEKDLLDFGRTARDLSSLKKYLKDDLDPSKVTEYLYFADFCIRSVNELYDFLQKYNIFFEVLKTKFSVDTSFCESLKPLLLDLEKNIKQMRTFVYQQKFSLAKKIYDDIEKEGLDLEKYVREVSMIPGFIDYNKLSNKDWRMIGIYGIHYRSRIFISYPYRDKDPKKDGNQIIIDIYIKPLLRLLNIDVITARDKLIPQDLVDDDIIKLIEECDGIIGFYTKGDDVSNIEHELAQNSNIIALCREEGAKEPSMRLSRLMINFERENMGDLLLKLINVLKIKSLFNLVI